MINGKVVNTGRNEGVQEDVAYEDGTPAGSDAPGAPGIRGRVHNREGGRRPDDEGPRTGSRGT